jgi:photosystem II stability/assembly factor-like uncharacterized protein
MVVCLAPGGQTTTIGTAQSQHLFVGTAQGLRGFERTANGWRANSTSILGQHISALAYEPGTSTLFAGTYDGGLLASADLGQTWDSRSAGLPFERVFTVHIQTRRAGVRVYAGLEPAHLFFSDDLGRSWTELPALRNVPSVEKWRFPGPPGIGHVKNMVFDPRSDTTLYTAIEVGGLLKSTDDGATWHELHGIDDDVHRALLCPSNPYRVYISGLEGICVSENGGGDWESLTTRAFRIGYPDALVMHPGNEQLMFAGGSRTSPGGWRTTHDADSRVMRTRDGGRSWDELTNGLPEHIIGNVEAMAMDVWDGGYALFAATTDGDVFGSEDEGEHWQHLAKGLPAISKVNHYAALGKAS